MPPISTDEFIFKLPLLFILSFVRTIQCGVPLEYRIRGGANGDVTLDAAEAPFDILRWTLAQHTSEFEEIASETLRSQDCSVAMLANVQDFPDHSISLFHFSNHAYRSKTTEHLKNHILKLHTTAPFNKLGIAVSSPEQFALQHLPTIDYAPPMAPTAQFWYTLNTDRNPKSHALRNLVVFVFDSYRRSSTDLPLMTTRTLNKCASQLQDKRPQLFNSPVAASAPVLQVEPPISMATASSIPTPTRKASRPKATKKPKEDPTKSEKEGDMDTKTNSKSNARSAPTQGTIDSANPFLAPSMAATPKSTAKPSILPSTSQRPAIKTSTDPSSSKAAPSSQQEPSTARQAKRKRPAGRDEASIAQEADVYISSIVDSLASIVTTSANPDFVTACFAKLGLSPSTDLSDQRESAERRMEEFRRIIERNLRRATDLSLRQRKAVVNASGKTEHALSLEELVEDEEMDWIDGLSEEEIASLWTPTPSLPSDAKWNEMLWVPCTIPDLDESAFHHIVM